MVAHIKSQRLVAILIYSSLSIYASTGKKEYIIQMSSIAREINLILKIVVAWEDSNKKKAEKNHAFGFHAASRVACTKKECFSFGAYL
jgi:hypothetical protein